jgi:AcrR family transcriptional regulator
MAPSESPPGGRPEHDPDAFAGLPAELAMARLPPGRHGLPRAFVARNQRLRLVAAMLRVLPRHGYPAITVNHLTREAGVSRAAFYQRFADKEECFLAAFDLIGEWFFGQVERAVAGEEDRRYRIRLGAAEALRLLGANPPIAQLISVEALQAGRAARERQRTMLDRFAAVLRSGDPGGAELPTDLLLGGAAALVARYVDDNRAERLPDATATLVEYLLTLI